MGLPVISVISVCYNAECSIETMLHSVANQTYPNVEHILVDGDSTDDTKHIIAAADSVAKWVSEPDEGIYDAMNKGIKMASGDIIQFLNADDRLSSSDVLARIADVFLEDPELGLVIGQVEIQDFDRGVVIGECPLTHDQLCRGRQPPHPASFFRRSVFDKIGNYNGMYSLSADFELYCRLAAANTKSQVVPVPCVQFSCDGASASFCSQRQTAAVLSAYYGRTAALRFLLCNTPAFFIGRMLGRLRLRKAAWRLLANLRLGRS